MLIVFFCFCWSLGCALDSCPLSQHCPLDPKAVWLPLQATVPMAIFHSHLFSIWLWHIHINIQTTKNSVNLVTTPHTSCDRVEECSCAVLHPINLLDFRNFTVSINHRGSVWNVYAKSLHMRQRWVLWAWRCCALMWVEWIQLPSFISQFNLAWLHF